MRKHFEMLRKNLVLLFVVASCCLAVKVHAGVDGLGVWEPAAAAWRFSNSATAPSIDHTAAGFGLGGSGTPTAGDWDGDGIDGIGLFEPATDTWYLSNSPLVPSLDHTVTFGFGSSTQLPVAGQWVASTSANPQLISEEGFSLSDYSAGTLDGQNPHPGSNGYAWGWGALNDTPGSSRVIEAPSLSYSKGGNTLLTSAGSTKNSTAAQGYVIPNRQFLNLQAP